MTSATHSVASFAESHHHPAVTAALVFLLWLAAAGLVVAARTVLDPLSPAGAAFAGTVAVVLTAYAYMRLCARWRGVGHALGVGVAWLMLAIVAEVAMTAVLDHEWCGLLGSPERPLLRNFFLFVWIFAPSLFSQSDEEASD
jgi:hypothetical protein